MSAVWDAIEHPAQPPAAGGLSHTLELCSCINSLIHATGSKPLGRDCLNYWKQILSPQLPTAPESHNTVQERTALTWLQISQALQTKWPKYLCTSSLPNDSTSTVGLPFGSLFNIHGITEQDKRSVFKVDTENLLQKWEKKIIEVIICRTSSTPSREDYFISEIGSHQK